MTTTTGSAAVPRLAVVYAGAAATVMFGLDLAFAGSTFRGGG